MSLSGPTLVREVVGNVIRSREWEPEDFGLPRCELRDLRAESPEQSAAVIRYVLDDNGPRERWHYVFVSHGAPEGRPR